MKHLLALALMVGVFACQPQEQTPAPPAPPGAPGPQGVPGTPGRVDTVVVPAPEYFVQVAAVRGGAGLDSLLARLKDFGYTGRVARNRDDFYRVTVGPFAARQDALRVRNELRRRWGWDAFVIEPR